MNTNTTTTTTFEAAVDILGEEMMALYNRDENGNLVELEEEQEAVAKNTIEEVRKASIKAFTPLIQSLQDKVAEQEELIEALQAQVGALPVQRGAEPVVKKDGKPRLTEVKCPTLPELIELHKGKGTKFNGYTVFCVIYQNVHNEFPGEGIWKKNMSDAEKKPWNDVAKAYTEYRQAGAVAATPVAASTLPTMTPQVLQQAMLLLSQQQLLQPAGVDPKSKATSAYRLWLNDELKKPENKGKSNVKAGTWAQVPAAIKAEYEAKLKALQAARALKA
jgi:hypothetical protein